MTVEEIKERLAAPFRVEELKFKPQAIQGQRALPVVYIDARCVMERLDDVLGVDGWNEEYELLPDGNVTCRLRLKIGEEWVTKMDVGGPSEQPDGGDRMKAAFSDALKRAAVKFGIGRYLYSMKLAWADYDPQKRQFVRPPVLPLSATPKPPPRSLNPPTVASTGGGNPPPKKCSQQQVDEIDVLCAQLGKTLAWLQQQLMIKFGKDEPADLTIEEATMTIAAIKKMLPALAKPAAPVPPVPEPEPEPEPEPQDEPDPIPEEEEEEPPAKPAKPPAKPPAKRSQAAGKNGAAKAVTSKKDAPRQKGF